MKYHFNDKLSVSLGRKERLSEEGKEVIPGREKQEQRGGNYWHVRELAVR